MKTILIFALVSLLLRPLASVADHGAEEHNHDKTPSAEKELDDIAVKPNNAVFEVHGIVCSFCSVGVRKKLSKLPFIDTSEYDNGVLVEIENQKVTVAIKPGKTLDIKSTYESIKSGGYEPIKAIVRNTSGDLYVYNNKGELCSKSC